MIQIFDNILPEKQQKYIEDTLHDHLIDYYTYPNTVNSYVFMDDKNIREWFQFVHVLWDDQTKSRYKFIGDEILEAFFKAQPLEIDRVSRAKINMLTMSDFKQNELYNTPHIDNIDPHYVLIYYVNDSDGDTFIFEGKGEKIIKRVTPKRGRFLLFPGELYHAGRPPVNHKNRVLINFNLCYDI
jgi:hypothetical protein